ncbi:MAG: hypothetical protein ACXABY_24695 [Candidatus Thorarchaeota archaeon]|jgi:hypothetical protein
MVFLQSNPVTRFKRRLELKRIAKQVRAGHVPKGVSQDDIFEALRCTRPKGALEMFGILSAKLFRNGKMIQDAGVVSVKKVTLEFAEWLVDGMVSSGESSKLSDFYFHEMGSGSTAEASTDQALVSATDGREPSANEGTHGATSNVYQTVATITATTAVEIREHGLFNQTSTTGDLLLDRSVVTAFNVTTDDEVQWTYDLTILRISVPMQVCLLSPVRLPRYKDFFKRLQGQYN